MRKQSLLSTTSVSCLLYAAVYFLLTTGPVFAGVGAEVQETSGYKAAPAGSQTRWTGHLSYVFGYKRLEGDWSPAEDQLEVGLLDFDFKKKGWPLSFAGQLLMSYSGDVPQGLEGNNSGTYELNLGARKIWEGNSAVHPFIGGGVSIIGATNSTFIDFGDEAGNVNEHSAATVGAWAGAGLYWNFAENWHTGAQLQYSWGELRLGGKDLNAGGLHVLGMIGYHWP